MSNVSKILITLSFATFFAAPAFAQEADTNAPAPEAEQVDEGVNPSSFFPDALVLMDELYFAQKVKYFGEDVPKGLSGLGLKKSQSEMAGLFAATGEDAFAKKTAKAEWVAGLQAGFEANLREQGCRPPGDGEFEWNCDGKEKMVKEFVLNLFSSLPDDQKVVSDRVCRFAANHGEYDSVYDAVLWSEACFQALPPTLRNFHLRPAERGDKTLLETWSPDSPGMLRGHRVCVVYPDREICGIVTEASDELFKVKAGDDPPTQVTSGEVLDKRVAVYVDQSPRGATPTDTTPATAGLSPEQLSELLVGRSVIVTEEGEEAVERLGTITTVSEDGRLGVTFEGSDEPEEYPLSALGGKLRFAKVDGDGDGNNKGNGAAPESANNGTAKEVAGGHTAYFNLPIRVGNGVTHGKAYTLTPGIAIGGGYRLRVPAFGLGSWVMGVGADVGVSGVYFGQHADIHTGGERDWGLDSHRVTLALSPHFGYTFNDVGPFEWDASVLGVVEPSVMMGLAYGQFTSGGGLAARVEGEWGPFFAGIGGYYQNTGVTAGSRYGRPIEVLQKTPPISPIGVQVAVGLRLRWDLPF